MQKNKSIIEWVSCRYDELDATERALTEAAKKQAERAYAPYSNFKVGAAVRLASGTIVGGANQENAAYPSGLCAERVALFSAATQYPSDAPVQMAIIALSNGAITDAPISPCGGCRQVFTETVQRYGRTFELLLCSKDEVIKITASALTPLAFGSDGAR